MMQEGKFMNIRHAERGFIRYWGSRLFLRPLLAALLIAGLVSSAHAAPEGGVVRAGSAQIVAQGGKTIIQQSSQRAIIDWRGFGINANEQVQFAQPSASAATLNRVTGSQVSMILGRMDANGQVLLINPNGIIFGKGAQINVGSLIASTANLSNENFMQGRLIFDQPGKPGAGIINSGSITAAEGGLIALVAPHVRNDGLIQARLGKVTLGAADTFTIDLYGDGLINLALTDASLAQLKDAQGQPVKSLITQAGTIDVGGGNAVLVTAEAAKSMLDSLINMSGTILADSAVQEGGRILLLAKGGNVDVSGNLSARGTTGGQIDVLGDQVHLASTAKLDADGTYGNGKLHVGGAFQGSGDTYRSQSTQVDVGATLQASALTKGDGGEVVVWSDGSTAYAGSIQARGGAEGGDGGLVEVSGKQTLDFKGHVDAGATNGKAGSLLLDPYNFTIGIAESSLINRVLRTGTSTSVSADNDIYVNYLIDGRGLNTGGGLTLSAGNNINVNNYIITNNGAINLYAAVGTVNLAPGNVVYAGTAPITVRSGADLYNAPYLTGGLLSLISTKGSVFINQGIDASIGNLWLQAAEDVNVNQPIVSLSDGNSVNINAGNNINVNAQINGSGGVPGGTVTLAATAGNVNIYDHVVTNNGEIKITAGGTVTQAADGLDIYGAPLTKQVRAENAKISVTSNGIAALSLGSLVTTGEIEVASNGAININVPIYETTGKTTITAAGDININQVAANTTSGSDLTMTSTGGNIIVAAKVGPWDRATGATIDRNALPGGSITLQAYGNINVNKDIASYKGASPNAAAIRLTADTGTVNLLDGIKVMSDSGAIYVTTYGNMNNGPFINTAYNLANTDSNGVYLVNLKPSTGYFTTGPLSLTATNGNITINQTIPDTTGAVTLSAGDSIYVNQRIYSNGKDISLYAGEAATRRPGWLGGIVMTSQADPAVGFTSTYVLSDIDAYTGNLRLEAKGSIDVSVLRTGAYLTVKSTEGMIQSVAGCNGCGLGNIRYSRGGGGNYAGYPDWVYLAGSAGIGAFYTGESRYIKAISDKGSVDGLRVSGPYFLEVIARNDINMSGPWGYTLGNASLYAGGNITNPGGIYGGNITEKAGGDITVGSFSIPAIIDPSGKTESRPYSYVTSSLNLSAGTNPFGTFGDSYNVAGVFVAPLKNTWSPSGPGNISVSKLAWVDGTGGLTATATGSISMADIHVSGQSSLGLTAGSAIVNTDGTKMAITLPNRIEALGPVSLIAYNGNITISQTIGAHVLPIAGLWNPQDKGVASLFIEARNGNITMQEARAEDEITIKAYGNGATTGLITFGPGIESVSGTTLIRKYHEYNLIDPPIRYTYIPHIYNDTDEIVDTNDYATKISKAPVDRLPSPNPVPGVIGPGPTIAGPNAPILPGALPPGAPGIPGVAGYALPSEPSTSGTEQEVEANRLAANGQLSEIIPVEDEEEGDEENRKKILKISDGRSARQMAELGLR
jgi:filamentous hemagglutinin family protein